jgi:hypothetical protein
MGVIDTFQNISPTLMLVDLIENDWNGLSLKLFVDDVSEKERVPTILPSDSRVIPIKISALHTQ